jgi:hypothetical protein
MAPSDTNLYELLGLSPDTSVGVLEAYLEARLAGAQDEEEADFWRDAQATLLDPEQRATYDHLLKNRPSPRSTAYLRHGSEYYAELGVPPDVDRETLASALTYQLISATDEDERDFWQAAQDALLEPGARASYNRIIGAPPPPEASELPRLNIPRRGFEPEEPAGAPPPPQNIIWYERTRQGMRVLIYPIIILPGMWLWWQLILPNLPPWRRMVEYSVGFEDPWKFWLYTDGTAVMLMVAPTLALLVVAYYAAKMLDV